MGVYPIMNFTEILQQGTAHAWLYIPAAVVLGGLHGLEPGHSKTMMAAFIIAIRGTVGQAVLLGLSAALSHSFVIWALAALALNFGGKWNAESTEPVFQLFSAVVILGMAGWMFLRIRRDARAEAEHRNHHHGEEGQRVIRTGHGIIVMEVFEDGVPPVFRLRFSEHGKSFLPQPDTVALQTRRSDGGTEDYVFVARDGYLESTTPIPEPHEFEVELTVSHGDHAHTYRQSFSEHAEHCHAHAHGDHDHHSHHSHEHGHDHGHAHHHHHDEDDFQDAHEAAHAADIERRFANRRVTTWQIVLFGLTGGLMPCPAALTVLLVCLQVKQYSLGFALVAAFSVGLALIMVSVGAAAAVGVRHAEKKMKGFNQLMRKAPYVSCAVLVVIAAYMAWHGWNGLQHLATI